MKLKAEDLRSPKTIAISGDEDWLNLIYESFADGRPNQQKITGSLTVIPSHYGRYDVEGEVRFTPSVSCSRCEDMIPWEISRKVKVRFLEQAPLEEDEVERDLEPSDMDAYYLDEKGYLDLEIVVNDFIQTALPTRLVKTAADGKSCLVCHKDVSSKYAFKDEIKPEQSPFAALQNLKLPKD